MAEAVARAVAEGFTHVAFGDLFLEDIRRYRERQFAGSGVELLFPLWGRPTHELAKEMVESGLRAWITCVDTKRAPREWAGRIYDAAFVEQMPAGIDPCGENGEFHTFVFAGPMLSSPLAVTPGAFTEHDGTVCVDLLPY
jgi:diphthamide synthase (EF-2-diphthine--ammonia ligase)